MGLRNLSGGHKRCTSLGMALEQPAREILAHVKGNARLPTRATLLYQPEDTAGMGTGTE